MTIPVVAFPPTIPFTIQVTALLLLLETLAENSAFVSPRMVLVFGETVTEIAPATVSVWAVDTVAPDSGLFTTTRTFEPEGDLVVPFTTNWLPERDTIVTGVLSSKATLAVVVKLSPESVSVKGSKEFICAGAIETIDGTRFGICTLTVALLLLSAMLTALTITVF